MENVNLYVHNNTLQQHDAHEFLEMYSKRIQWKNGGTIIDIGSGDGFVTTNILKKSLPGQIKIVGCDKNEGMVKFANTNYRSNDTYFTILDIEGVVPEKMQRTFQYVFSSYVLHWTRRPEIVYRNIFDLLDEGGECLLMFLGHNSTYTTYRNLAKTRKWRPWLKDVEDFICPFHDNQDPVKEIKRIMYKIGFTNVDVAYKPKSFSYGSMDAKLTGLRAVNPFKVPEDLFQQFMDDIIQEMQRIDGSNKNIEYSELISTFYYNLIYIHAIK